MIAYQYDENGVYVGTYVCQRNPMVSGEFLVPANATLVAPPDLAVEEIAVFSNGAWEVQKQRALEPDVKIEKRLTLKEKRELAMRVLRATRDRLLAESDFAMLPDAPDAIKEKLPEIIAYRAALRDITKTVTDATKPYELPKKPF